MVLNCIKKLRKERNLTQAQLGEALGVSASTIGMYEQGRREPDRKMFLRLSKFFNVPLEYLMNAFDNEEEPIDLNDFLAQIRWVLSDKENLTFGGDPLQKDEVEELLKLFELGTRFAYSKKKNQ